MKNLLNREIVKNFIFVAKENKYLFIERLLRSIIAIILYIVYGLLLTPVEFGILNVLLSYFYVTLALQNIFYPCYVKYYKERFAVFFNHFLYSIIVIIFSVLMILIINKIEYLIYFFVLQLFDIIFIFSLGVYNAEENYKKIALLRLSTEAIFSGFAILLIPFLGIKGVFIGLILGKAIPFFLYVFPRIEIKIDIKYYKLAFSRFSGQIPEFIQNYLEPTIYYFILTPVSLGNFFLCYRFNTTITKFIVDTIGVSIQPKIVRRDKKGIKFYFLIAMILHILGIMFLYFLYFTGFLSWLFKNYTIKFYILSILSIVFFLESISRTISNVLVYEEKYFILLVSSLIGIIIWLAIVLYFKNITGILFGLLAKSIIKLGIRCYYTIKCVKSYP